MSTSKVEGAFDEAKGKVKQTVGEATNNQSLANSGAADEVKGKAEETWGNIKDTAKDVGKSQSAKADAREQQEGHSVRDSVTSTAANVKDSIGKGLDKLKQKSSS